MPKKSANPMPKKSAKPVAKQSAKPVPKKSANPMPEKRSSLRNLVSELLDRTTQRRHRSEISQEGINGQLKRCAAVLCSEACQDFAAEELNLWFQVAMRKGTHEMKALMYLLDLILTRYIRQLKNWKDGKDDAALEKVAKGCIGEDGRSLAMRLLEYLDYKMKTAKNWMECKDYIKVLAYKWESAGFFRSPLVKRAVCQILREVNVEDHMKPEIHLQQKTRPPGDIMVPKLPHLERDQRHFYENLLYSKVDRQERFEAFMRGMHADTKKERERAQAMEKRRCDQLGRKPRPIWEIETLKEELRQELETELANLPAARKMPLSGVEKLRARKKSGSPLPGLTQVPYVTEFSTISRFYPTREDILSGGEPLANRVLGLGREPAVPPAAREPTEKPAPARLSGAEKAAVSEPAKAPAAREPTEKPAPARLSGAEKAAPAEPAKAPAAREPTEKPAPARLSGAEKAAVAEPAKTPAARKPREKPASARVSGDRPRAVKRSRTAEPAAPEDASKKRRKSDDEKSAKEPAAPPPPASPASPAAPPPPAPGNKRRKIKWQGGSVHVWPTLGDHRCLFRAVVRGICDPYNRVPRDVDGEPLRDVDAAMEMRNADLIRRELCDYMQRNQALVKPFMDPPGSDATAYIKSMRSPTMWADQICTRFLPDVIKCPIHVQAWNRELKSVYDVGVHLPSRGGDGKRGPIFLYYNGRTHYELVSQQQIFKRRSMGTEIESSTGSTAGSSSSEN